MTKEGVMDIKRTIVVMFLLLAVPVVGLAFDHGHSVFTSVLGKHVKVLRGEVDFEINIGALKKDQSELKKYLTGLSTVSQKEFDGWTKDQQLSFLINAYNGFTIELILKNYPVKSIRKIGAILQSPWKIDFIKLLDKTISLDDIEHGLVRKKGVYDEPRIHFALVCASIGCPALHNKSFTADTLEEMLETGMMKFLSDKTRNRYNKKSKSFEVTKLFKWYGGDFNDKYGTVNKLLKKYAIHLIETKSDLAVAEKTKDIDYLDYDWNLNDVSTKK